MPFEQPPKTVYSRPPFNEEERGRMGMGEEVTERGKTGTERGRMRIGEREKTEREKIRNDRGRMEIGRRENGTRENTERKRDNSNWKREKHERRKIRHEIRGKMGIGEGEKTERDKIRNKTEEEWDKI